MKNLVIFLIVCLVFVQSTYAVTATSVLSESLIEYEAILSAIGTDPEFEGVIGSTEFVVDIVRKTDRLNVLGTVKYFIKTCTINNKDRCKKLRTYIAVLNVAPHPGIGPHIVTVLSIEKKDSKSKAKNKKETLRVERLPKNKGVKNQEEHRLVFGNEGVKNPEDFKDIQEDLDIKDPEVQRDILEEDTGVKDQEEQVVEHKEFLVNAGVKDQEESQEVHTDSFDNGRHKRLSPIQNDVEDEELDAPVVVEEHHLS